MKWTILLLVIVGVVVGILSIQTLYPILISDLRWAFENYPDDRILHSMFYENSIFGRFVQP